MTDRKEREMNLPEFEFKIGRLTLHNKEQWDLNNKIPLLCGHWTTRNKCSRLFCVGKINGYYKKGKKNDLQT